MGMADMQCYFVSVGMTLQDYWNSSGEELS